MTWNELIEKLNKMTPEQRNTDVTVYVSSEDEFYPLASTDKPLYTAEDDDVLDKGHPFLII